ncbi:TPA: hypothetical protein ACX3GU_004782 [Vibrio parahaemolyticus]
MTDDWKKKPVSSSGGGYRPLHDRESEKPVTREETTRERAERQRRERRAELTYTAEDYARWERNRERVLAERKTEVPKFDLEEVLANPELDAIKPVNIDPASMLADDIESLVKEGEEFINNPTWAGLATMAAIAVPGKAADGAIDSIKAVSKKERLKLNKIKGDAFEKTTLKELEKTQSGIVSQVTVKTQSGTKTRIDLLGFDDNGVIKCTECKASASAPLTKNQKKAFPEMELSGGVVVGKGKDGFEGGTVIPPTKIDIIRPKK